MRVSAMFGTISSKRRIVLVKGNEGGFLQRSINFRRLGITFLLVGPQTSSGQRTVAFSEVWFILLPGIAAEGLPKVASKVSYWGHGSCVAARVRRKSVCPDVISLHLNLQSTPRCGWLYSQGMS